MLFSPSAMQALRALIFLAGQGTDRPVQVRAIAAAEGIPRPYLSKLLHALRNSGIVRATRGPGGGYSLARPASKVRVSDVVEVFDGTPNLTQRCLLGLDECTDQTACALHEHWKKFREQYAKTITSLKLDEVATVLERKREQRTRIR